MKGFQSFILRGNVVELAVAVVLGTAFNTIVQSFVEGVITPLLGLFGGVPDFAHLTLRFGPSIFLIGSLINAAIAFALMASLLYFLIVAPYEKLLERFSSDPAPMNMRLCPHCLSKIPDAATRCAFCTAEVEAVN